MSRRLRKLAHYSRRALLIWRLQGFAEIVRSLNRRSGATAPRVGTGRRDKGHHRSERERADFRRALVVDYALPTPDRDSGSLRMVNLLAILKDEGFQITFASMGLEAREPYLSRLQKRGIECLHRPLEDLIVEHLRELGARYDLVILSHVLTAAELMHPTRRWCPTARILYDTVDLHHVRLAREARIRKDKGLARIARRVEREELSLAARADATLVVSAVEKTLLERAVPGADVRVVSNIHRTYGSAKPFEDRRNILFVGGFAHPPNKDAVLFFCREVLPTVLSRRPEMQLFVVGSDPPADVAALAGAKVHILGYVPDITPYLTDCRLSIAPLRFGAGVKGKINQSLAHGLPVVATSLAAEGMCLTDGDSVLIADQPQAFAEAVLRLYGNPNLWRRLSEGGLAVMEKRFGFAAARDALTGLLAPISSPSSPLSRTLP